MAGHFFIRLHVRQQERLLLDDGSRKLDEAAIGVDRHGLGDFFEGRAGFIVTVDEYGNSDVYPRGSLPCNFAFCHDTLNEATSTRAFPDYQYGISAQIGPCRSTIA